ncbi:class I SAM-dependent methyltransferase [Haloplanus halobius]|uniref:class I SAM-dependent methyltransferase n=1 Tax=Haloplanus halobius TaxID=2934938 RepID=UPI00200D42E3|nr:class I SAM-dependent methyltransferase [Haloplanus sp. XH21]
MRSNEVGAPVDQDGEPIPWYTYPTIDFIEPRTRTEFRVFEFGSGHSSLWYSDRVKEVVAVEDSKEWATAMQERSPSNLTVVYEPDLDDYASEVTAHGSFDIVVIDGRVRQSCVGPTLEAITDHGVVILDDFERWDDSDWARFRDAGFRALPFVGPKAQRLTESCTGILYRDENCLDI